MTTEVELTMPYMEGITQLSSYEEINEVLRSPDFVQSAFDVSAPHFLDNTLVMLDGSSHFDRRRIEAHLFSRRALSRYKEEKLAPMVERTLRELAAAADGDRIKADLVPLTWRMLGKVAATVTGLDLGDGPEEIELLLTHVRRFARALTVEWSTDDREITIADGLRARAEFVEDFFARSSARRRDLVARYKAGLISKEEVPQDLITLLYLHWDEAWDAGLPLRETTLFLVGSTATTAQAFPHFIKHIESWMTEHPGDRHLIADDPQFLRQALFESLRLFVAAPARLRRSLREVVLKSGRKIAEGERVGLLFQPANADPGIFGDDAMTFNPFRTPEGSTAWGLSFGGGEHACIGRPLVTGIHNSHDQTDGTMVVIARMLYQAGLSLDPDRPLVPDETTHYDMFESMPILLDGRHRALPRT